MWKDGLAWLEKQMYVLHLGLSLPCHDFEFGANIILGMVDPVKDIRSRFFFIHIEQMILDVLQ